MAKSKTPRAGLTASASSVVHGDALKMERWLKAKYRPNRRAQWNQKKQAWGRSQYVDCTRVQDVPAGTPVF